MFCTGILALAFLILTLFVFVFLVRFTLVFVSFRPSILSTFECRTFCRSHGDDRAYRHRFIIFAPLACHIKWVGTHHEATSWYRSVFGDVEQPQDLARKIFASGVFIGPPSLFDQGANLLAPKLFILFCLETIPRRRAFRAFPIKSVI